MALLSIIVAIDKNYLIGNNNQLPWHLPADLKHFKETTMGKPILMGRKTWESLGRPLPGRENIVITRNPKYEAEGASIVYSLDEALAASADAQEVMVIGGANLYAQALPRADRLYLTKVNAEFEGDAWFPEIDESAWETKTVESHLPDERNVYPYEFIVMHSIT